jgi:hypothetical protein
LPLSDTITTAYGGRAQCAHTMSTIEIVLTVNEQDSKGNSSQVAGADNMATNTRFGRLEARSDHCRVKGHCPLLMVPP